MIKNSVLLVSSVVKMLDLLYLVAARYNSFINADLIAAGLR